MCDLLSKMISNQSFGFFYYFLGKMEDKKKRKKKKGGVFYLEKLSIALN